MPQLALLDINSKPNQVSNVSPAPISSLWQRSIDVAPLWLWARQIAMSVLALVLGISAYATYHFLAQVAQTVGTDTVPSIVAAEKIRTTLAYAHTSLANYFLTGEAHNSASVGPSMHAYQLAMAEAHEHLLSAAQNITYGEAERGPILVMMSRLAEYERLVGAAIHAGSFDASATAADTLMRDTILPAAVQLDQANFDHLDASYQQFKHDAQMWRTGILALALILLALMFETQWRLTHQFRRIINPALAAATVILIFSTYVFMTQSARELESIRSAKEDAFDSIHALMKTKALAYNANAQESIYLLHTGNKPAQADDQRRFMTNAQMIWSGRLASGNRLPGDLSRLKGQGLLGDELANITYPGELDAAIQTLSGWLNYAGTDANMRALENDGKHNEAVALSTGTREGESAWAFSTFDRALDNTLKINQDAFDSGIAKAFSQVHWLLFCAVLMLLAPLAGALVGLQQRLAEFRA